MNAADSGRGVVLDRANPYEALILNQLNRRPPERRSDWLRQLLVKGFLRECQERGRDLAQNGVAPRPTVETPTTRPVLAVVPHAVEPPTRPSIETTEAAAVPVSFTFADLRKVIG